MQNTGSSSSDGNFTANTDGELQKLNPEEQAKLGRQYAEQFRLK